MVDAPVGDVADDLVDGDPASVLSPSVAPPVQLSLDADDDDDDDDDNAHEDLSSTGTPA